MVVHGAPGLDEISPLGITEVREVRGGSVTSWAIDPAAHGIASIATEELAGGDPAENAAVIEAVLNGNGPAGARAAVLLNAAAALYVSSDALGYDEAVRLTRVALDGGAGRAALDRLRQASRAAAGRWPRHA
jgi:anthranilate phosphoribosyltransferase